LDAQLGIKAYQSGLKYDIKKYFDQAGIIKPSIGGGHSLGATLLQYHLANGDDFEDAYLFAGPGIPEEEAKKFEEKKSPVKLHVFKTDQDTWCKVGQVHLGHKSDNVRYVRFHSPTNGKDNPHTTVWGKKGSRYYGIEGGISEEEKNADFYHKDTFKERIRSTVGPVFASLLRLTRDACRAVFSSRANQELGLSIGLTLPNGKWYVDRFN